jgi:hypothetical protein
VGIFQRFLDEFLGYLEWLGPNGKFFSETEGYAVNFQTRRDHGKIYRKLRGLNAKW